MKETMKAVVYKEKGVLEFIQRPVPQIINKHDAIVKVKASSICSSDLHILHGLVPRAKKDIILGHEFVGEVIAVGTDVQKVAVGDRVAVNVETFCGTCKFCKAGYINNCREGGWELGCRIDGCQTEYVRVPFADNGLSKLPDSVSYEDAVLVGDVLSSGYFGAELAEIKPGDCIAIIGAGPVGFTTMMCARLFGPSKIIVIDVIEQRLQLAKDSGLADITINATQEDVESRIKELTNNDGVDAVIEAAGGENTFELAWKIARPNAVVALIALYPDSQQLPLHLMYGKNLIFKTGGVDAIHCERLITLIESGKIDTKLIHTHYFTLDQIMDAYKIFENKIDDCIKCIITNE